MKNKLKIIFAGSSNISSIFLEFLLKKMNNIEILAVFTNNLNKNKYILNPVENLCKKHNLKVFNNISIHNKNIIDKIKILNPKLILVIAYGKILTNKILSIPKYGCINVHFSQLPRWIGAAPIQRAIIANDKITGISIIKMNSKLDNGKIIFNSNYCIKKYDNTITLTNILNNLAKKGLLIILNKFIKKEPILYLSQNLNSITYARKIYKKETKLNWVLPSFYLVRYINALLPTPTTYFKYKNIRIKILEANAFLLNIEEENKYKPGQIICIDKNGIKIASGLGILNIKKIQMPGKRPVNINCWLNSKKNSKIFTLFDIVD